MSNNNPFMHLSDTPQSMGEIMFDFATPHPVGAANLLEDRIASLEEKVNKLYTSKLIRMILWFDKILDIVFNL